MILICVIVRNPAGLNALQICETFHHPFRKPGHWQAFEAGNAVKYARYCNCAVRLGHRAVRFGTRHDQVRNFWRNHDRLLNNVVSFAGMVVDVEVDHLRRDPEMDIVALRKLRMSPGSRRIEEDTL